MDDSKATSLLVPLLVLMVVFLIFLIAGCSGGDTTSKTTGRDFQEGTLSSSSKPAETTGLTKGPSGSSKGVLLRVEGGKSTRFSGLCTVGDQEYIISGAPSKTYSFEDSPLSCRIKKRDPSGSNLKVTLVSGNSTRSVQQTNAQGGIVDISRGGSQ